MSTISMKRFSSIYRVNFPISPNACISHRQNSRPKEIECRHKKEIVAKLDTIENPPRDAQRGENELDPDVSISDGKVVLRIASTGLAPETQYG